MRILITGGAGYIGSHTLVDVLAAGHAVHVIDNFSTGRAATLDRVRRLTGRGFGVTRADIRDAAAVAAAVDGFAPQAVIHFAGLKVPGRSIAAPLDYYATNVAGTIALLEVLAPTACRQVVFSSSAAVYGDPDYLPVDEAHPRRPASPYGRGKLQIEAILEDLAASHPAWSAALLRYFNPVGAHASGWIGEDPAGEPGNLMPHLVRIAAGAGMAGGPAGDGAALRVFGADYATPDGTGVRDYIHVSDLARAHLAAVDWTADLAGRGGGCAAFNLGTGTGTSVLEMVRAFEAASGRRVPLCMAPRRAGDVAASYADPARAARELGWRAELGLAEMCASAWAWQAHDGPARRTAASPGLG
jgi:UDP-glucose 4-epimerase